MKKGIDLIFYEVISILMGVVGREKRKKTTNGFLASFAKKGRQLDLGQEQGGSFSCMFS